MRRWSGCSSSMSRPAPLCNSSTTLQLLPWQQQLSQAAAQLEQQQQQASQDGAAAGQLAAFQQELSTVEQARHWAERQAQHLLHKLQQAENTLSESQAAAAVAQERLQQEVASAKVSVDTGQRLARRSGPLYNSCDGIDCLQAQV